MHVFLHSHDGWTIVWTVVLWTWYDYSRSIIRLTKISDDENLGLRFTKTHHGYRRPSQDDSMIELRLITIRTWFIQSCPMANGFCACLKFSWTLNSRWWIEKYCCSSPRIVKACSVAFSSTINIYHEYGIVDYRSWSYVLMWLGLNQHLTKI